MYNSEVYIVLFHHSVLEEVKAVSIPTFKAELLFSGFPC